MSPMLTQELLPSLLSSFPPSLPLSLTVRSDKACNGSRTLTLDLDRFDLPPEEEGEAGGEDGMQGGYDNEPVEEN